MLQVEDVRAELLTALGTDLGKYQFADDLGTPQVIDAIWVVNDVDKDPPADHERHGLECLIFPPLPRGDPFYGDTTQIIESWEVRLIQHDRGSSVRSAARKILKAWPTAKPSYIRASREFNEQATINLINDWEVV